MGRKPVFRFENPEAFVLFAFIPLLYIARRTGFFSRIRFPLTLGDWQGFSFRWSAPFFTAARLLAGLCFLCAFCLVVAAFANPVMSRQEKIYTSKGVEILFVLDTSPSMAAQDMGGSTRLAAAKQVIRRFAGENDGAGFALVAVASDAGLLVPPTVDHKTFLDRLDSLAVGEMGDGTAIGLGLAVAAYHMSASDAPKRAVVLLTDGENNSGSVNPSTAARLLADEDISFYIVGMGSRGTVPIEYVEPSTGKVYSGYLDSSFDENALKKLAADGNGLYFYAENSRALSSALSDIKNREAVVQSFYYKPVNESFEAPFLLSAAILFAVSWMLRRLVMGELL